MRRPEGFDRRVDDTARRDPAPARRPDADRSTPEPTAAADGSASASRAAANRLLAGVKDAVWSPVEKVERVPRSRPLAEPRDRDAARRLRIAARRRRREERAEVRRFTRRTRRRKITWLVVAGTALTMAGLVAVAVYSPLLALTTIRVEGTSRIPAADLEKAIDGQLGTPLALLDFDRITAELGDFPLIRSYVTETVPPDTLVVQVIEREPIGSIQTSGGFALVDPAGIVIERSTGRIPGVPLLAIGGTDTDVPAFDAAVAVLVALPDSVLARLDTITAASTDDVRLTLAGTGAPIIWGSAADSEYKGRALDALLANVPEASEFNVSAPGQASYKP